MAIGEGVGNLPKLCAFEFQFNLFIALLFIIFHCDLLTVHKVYLYLSFQWLSGLITFLFPGLASHLRAAYLPVHVFFGLLIFILACTTALLGITEKTIWSL